MNAAERAEARRRNRAEDPDLTVFDTGEIFQPYVHPDQTGNVDFDNDSGETEVTLLVYPSTVDDDTLVLDITAGLFAELKIVVNDGDVATIDLYGKPRPHAPELTADQDEKLRQLTQLRNELVDAVENGADTIEIDDVISDLNKILKGEATFA